jgi:hypothetical protein
LQDPDRLEKVVGLDEPNEFEHQQGVQRAREIPIDDGRRRRRIGNKAERRQRLGRGRYVRDNRQLAINLLGVFVQPLHRVKYCLDADPTIRPVQRAGVLRLFSRDDLARVRWALIRTARRRRGGADVR